MRTQETLTCGLSWPWNMQPLDGLKLGWSSLSWCLKLHDNYAEVVYEKYNRMITNDPTQWTAHFRLAFAYYFMDKNLDAIRSFERVLEFNPTHVWSMGLLGVLYGEKKNYTEAIKWSKKALKINNNATAIHFLLGQAYYETGNYFGVIGQTLSVGRLKSIEAKYRPTPPIGIL